MIRGSGPFKKSQVVGAPHFSYGKSKYHIARILMQIRNALNSTESNAYEMMFGKHIRTFLAHIKPNRLVARKKCEELTTKIHRNLQVGQKFMLVTTQKEGRMEVWRSLKQNRQQ